MKVLLLFVLIPLASSFLIAALARGKKYAGDVIANAASASLLAVSIYSLLLVKTQKIILYKIGGWFPPLGISLSVDGLASFMLVTVNLIAFLVMLYSVNYMKRYTDVWKFHSLFMLMLAGMNGIITSADIFSLYIFLEAASIAGYALVAFGTEAEDLEASFKYAILGSLASIFILLGIVLIYSYTSTLAMSDIAAALSSRPAGALSGFVSVLFLAGFGMKAALVPFHSWLADAHSCAPSPVSATLSGVFIKTAGIYALARIFFNVIGVSHGLQMALMVLGVASMVVGAFLAIAQTDIKRMFAYSSISQVGYIFFALGLGTPLAILGGLFHLFNHACFKSLLFLDAGAIEYSTGERNLNRLGGLSKELPVTGFTSLLGSMSISGIPPFAGFFSKLIIIFAAIEARYFGFAFIAVVISIVTLAYYLKFQTSAFFGQADKSRPKVSEVPLAMKLSMITLAVICVIGGFLLTAGFKPYLQSAASTLVSAPDNQKIAVSSLKP